MSKHRRRTPFTNANRPVPAEAEVTNHVIAEVVAPGKPFTPGVGERVAADPAFKGPVSAREGVARESGGVFGGSYAGATDEWWNAAKGT